MGEPGALRIANHGDATASDKLRMPSMRKLIAFAPALLSLVALGLSAYALVDFAQFVKDYRQLEKDVEAQSQEDFEFLVERILEVFQLLRSFSSSDYCSHNADAGAQYSFGLSLELVQQLTERLSRVSVTVLPAGPIWEDFVERFPAQDGYDYSHFATPSRIPVLAVYGVPNMEPLFKTFTASLISDIFNVLLIFVPIVFHWCRPKSKSLCMDKVMLVADCGFLLISFALLGATVSLVDSTRGYDVETVKGRAVFVETAAFTGEFKHMINPDHWGYVPQEYCENPIDPCHVEEYSYQPNCSVASIDISVPKDFLLQKDEAWFLDLNTTGESLMERNQLRGYEAIFDPDNALITDFFNYTFGYLLPALPEDFANLIDTVRQGMIAGACPSNRQEFVWTDEALESVSFPVDDPDYDLICNAECAHDWDPFVQPTSCGGGSCALGESQPLNFAAACFSNCPTIDTMECGCGSFNVGMWKYNCTSSLPAITDDNYSKFTSFAVENTVAGLKFDVAATVIDFVAILIGAAMIVFPKVRKWVQEDDCDVPPAEKEEEICLEDGRKDSLEAFHQDSYRSVGGLESVLSKEDSIDLTREDLSGSAGDE